MTLILNGSIFPVIGACEDIFKIGSMASGAMLHEASKEFQVLYLFYEAHCSDASNGPRGSDWPSWPGPLVRTSCKIQSSGVFISIKWDALIRMNTVCTLL